MTDTHVAAPVAPRRRRWLRVLLVVVLLLVVLVAVAPLLAAPWVAGLVVSQANANVNGRAELQELSFGWGGGVHVAGLTLADRDGEPVLALGKLDAEVDVFGALSGRYDATVRLAGLRVDVRRDASGELNLATLPRRAPPAGGEGGGSAPAPGPAGKTGSPGALPDLHVDFELTDGEVVVHDGARATTLADLRLALRLDGLDRPAPFELSARVLGPEGPGGALSLRGELTAADGGRPGADGVRARVDLLLQDILLAALQPAAAALAGLDELQGTLSGTGAWNFAGPLSVDGRSVLTLAGLHAAGGPLTQPLDLPDVRLVLQAGLDAQGAGAQTLELSAGDALALRWDGRSRGLLEGEGALDGELSLTARLAPLLGLLGGALPLREGLALDGGARVLLQPSLALRDGAPVGGQVALQAGLSGLSARDAQGRPLDLGELQDIDLGLRAAFDAAAGALRLDELRLQAGPLTASGRGGVTGLSRDGAAFDPQALSVQDGALQATADLDRLVALAGRVVDLGDLVLGGRLTLSATLAGDGQRVSSDATLDVAGLRVVVAGLPDLPPLDLALRERGTLDLSPGGRSELQELSLVTSFLELHASGALTDVADDARRAGRIEPVLLLRPAAAADALGPLLGALRPSGPDVRLSGGVDVRGAALDAALTLEAPRLELAGFSDGPPLRLDGLKLELDAGLPGPQRAEVRRLALALAGAHAAGADLPPLSLQARASFDGAAGTLDVPELRLESGPARGGGTLALQGLSGVPVVRADLAFEGGVEPLRALLAAFAPDLAAAQGSGTWALELKADGDGARSTLHSELRLAHASLTGFAPGGQELSLRNADVALLADLDLETAGAGSITARALTLTAPGLDLQASGSARGFLAPGGGEPDPAALAGDLQATLSLQPAELQARLSALLGGLTLAGEPLSAQVTAGTREGVHTARATLRGARLDVTLPADAGGAPRTLSQRDLVLDLDATADLRPRAGRLELRSARLQSSTATVALAGTLTGLDRPGAESADLTLQLDAELARVLADLAGVLPPGLPQVAGALSLRGALTGDQGRLALQADTTVRDLVATLPGATPLVVRDPELRLGLTAGVATQDLDVDLQRGELASTIASGTFGGRLLGLAGDAPRADGLHAELRYVPDRLAALLGDLLPVGLSGAQEETLTLKASGPLGGADLRALLTALDVDARIGTGTLALPGLSLGGTTTITARAGSLRLGGNLLTDGGRITLDSTLDLRRTAEGSAPRSTITAKVVSVRAAGGLGSALAAINPLFASAMGGGGEAQATLDAGLDLAWDGELPLESLLAGGPLPLKALSGTSQLGLTEVKLAGSPLMSDLLGRLGRSGSTTTSLEPVSLALRGGRVHYEQPWAIALGGTPTTFTGSVGLDGTLDLSWNVPVTDELAGKHAFLARLKGQSIGVPLRGTLSGPKLAWDSALGDLAKKAAEQELKDRLGGLLGGAAAGGAAAGGKGGVDAGSGGAPGGAAKTNDPAALLTQADALWDAGKKDEARPLYKRLKDDFKLTTTYLFNKDRIDERAKAPKKKPGGGGEL